MKYGLKRVSVEESDLTVEEFKLHARIDSDYENPLLDRLLNAALGYVEDVTGRCIATAQYKMTFDSFPMGYCSIDIPRSPLKTIDLIRYRDGFDGTLKTLPADNYVVDNSSLVGRIAPIYLGFWPLSLAVINAVEITFTAGHDDDDPELETLEHLIYMLASGLYQFREPIAAGISVSDLPVAISFDMLLSPYIVPGFGG